MMFVPHRKHAYVSMASYGDSFISLYVDDVRTCQGTHLCASTGTDLILHISIVRGTQPMVMTIEVEGNINIWQGFLLRRAAHPLESRPLRMWVRSCG
jgi:hypothetical protein